MVDILRAIHLHTPTVLTASDLSIPLWSVPELHFQSLYLSINNDHHMLPSTLNADEYLLLLLAILSDTVSMLLTLGLLANPSAPTLNQLMEHNLSNMYKILLPSV